MPICVSNYASEILLSQLRRPLMVVEITTRQDNLLFIDTNFSLIDRVIRRIFGLLIVLDISRNRDLATVCIINCLLLTWPITSATFIPKIDDCLLFSLFFRTLNGYRIQPLLFPAFFHIFNLSLYSLYKCTCWLIILDCNINKYIEFIRTYLCYNPIRTHTF